MARISADELEKSWDFYHSLFGWEAIEEHDMGPEMGPYRIYGKNGFQLGGMYKRPPSMPVNAFNVYILVDDVDKDTERVKAAGGQNIMPPMEVPGGDKIAGFTDPQGAVFWLHAKKRAEIAEAEPGVLLRLDGWLASVGRLCQM